MVLREGNEAIPLPVVNLESGGKTSMEISWEMSIQPFHETLTDNLG